jgi:hypothetical protein
MQKYILITADTNDADFVTEQNEITDDQIARMKSIVAKMPKDEASPYTPNSIPYRTGEMGDDDRLGSSYNYINGEDKAFLDEFLPRGDYNYPGIHTIYNIDIIQIIETIY